MTISSFAALEIQSKRPRWNFNVKLRREQISFAKQRFWLNFQNRKALCTRLAFLRDRNCHISSFLLHNCWRISVVRSEMKSRTVKTSWAKLNAEKVLLFSVVVSARWTNRTEVVARHFLSGWTTLNEFSCADKGSKSIGPGFLDERHVFNFSLRKEKEKVSLTVSIYFLFACLSHR